MKSKKKRSKSIT